MSGGPFHSSSWHRVAGLRPRLAEHAVIHRHTYRGTLWYVIDDRMTGRVHRFTPAAYRVISRMDGIRTVDELWQEAVRDMGQDAPGQDAVIQLLGLLHTNDLLRCDVMPDAAELFVRFGRQAGSLWRANLKNPLSIRIPLWDPDRFLVRTLPWLRPVLSRGGLLIWAAVVGYGLSQAAVHWEALSEDFSDRVLAAQNLVLLWLVFPLIKLLHELGHAYTSRRFGGAVHELGVMLLALTVVPYVNASASAGFRNKWHRFLVGGAGMMVELFIASLCLVFWLMVQPGMLKAVLFDAMLIAGVSTLVFNGNPLLRYDGYYMLSDLIEIPNLGAGANRYWHYLSDRYLFGLKNAQRPDATRAEQRWFLFYGPASYVYRFLVFASLALFLATEFFVIGVLLALWATVTSLVLPIWKSLSYAFFSPRLAIKRRRAVWTATAIGASLVVLLGVVPAPLRTIAEGVIWLPEQAEVRAGSAGFVAKVLAKTGAAVTPGMPLVACEDPVLTAEIAVYRAKIAELEARRIAEWVHDRVQMQILEDDLARERANLARAEERAGHLLLRSALTGRFVLAREDDLPGRFVKQGELLGYVVDGAIHVVRVIVEQDDIDLVRRSTRSIQVRFPHAMRTIIPATLLREVPAAKADLPSPALGSEGGGEQVVDPRDPEGHKPLASLFQFDLALADVPPEVTAGPIAALPTYGSRVYVRFEHVPEPLVFQGWRRLRQLFLSRLHV